MFKIQKKLPKFTIHLIIILLFSIIACRKGVDVVTELPPADASLGDTWRRPTDNMVMAYVPAGKFDMGTDEASFYIALRLCHSYFGGNEVFIPDLDSNDTIAKIEEWNVSEENDISQGDVIGSIRTSENEIINIWSNYKGEVHDLELPSSPEFPIIYNKDSNRPQIKLDVNNGNGMSITIGRLEKDTFFDKKFIGLSHNTIRGASGGAILMAELLVKKGTSKSYCISVLSFEGLKPVVELSVLYLTVPFKVIAPPKLPLLVKAVTSLPDKV